METAQSLLTDALANGFIVAETAETRGPLPVQYEPSSVDTRVAENAPESVDATFRFIWNQAAGDPVAPASITAIDFQVGPSTKEHPVPGDSDTGYLGAELNLSASEQITLESFLLDLSSGDFCWNISHPSLTSVIPGGDESSVIHTDTYQTGVTDMTKVLTDYMTQQQAALVFTDGTIEQLGSGESVQYDPENDEYRSWYNIFSAAEDLGMDILDRRPDHLLIGENEYPLITVEK